MSAAARARTLAQRARSSTHARRQLLELPAASADAPGPSVYFLTPDHDSPAGGIRVIYRHVDLLNAAGINASVLHQKPGFRCTWFEHETVIRYVRHTNLGRRDLLVVGERNVGSLYGVSPPYKHVVFNQNSFQTWAGHPARTTGYYREGPMAEAILTVSEYARAFLQLAFPKHPVMRVHLAIGDRFHRPDSPRERTITYMPRKGAGDQAALVRALLEGSGIPSGWRFDPLDGLPQHEVASRLQSSQIFLSFADREGFGLPAAEAMACGNYVIGSHGYGGREFFDPQYCSPVGAGDVLGTAQALLGALHKENSQPGWLADRGRQAAESVTLTYSPDAERRDVIDTYSQLLGLG